MNKQELYSKKDLIGRFKVIYALQVANPRLSITSMPISSRYDLEVYNPDNGTTQYLEIKDRDCNEDTYPTAMLNPEKFVELSGYSSSFWYVNVYKDGKIDFFQPTEMPPSGVTVKEYYVPTSTVENGPKRKMKRYELNINDKTLQLENKITIIDKDGQS